MGVVVGVQERVQEELALHTVALPLRVVERRARGVGAAHDSVKLRSHEPRSADALRHHETQLFSACYVFFAHESREHFVDHLRGTRDTLCLPGVGSRACCMPSPRLHTEISVARATNVCSLRCILSPKAGRRRLTMHSSLELRLSSASRHAASSLNMPEKL